MTVKLGLLISTILVIFCVLVSLSYAIEEENIVAIWLFNEGQGNVAEDFSGNGHDGEFVGKLKWVEGKFGKALFFPGKARNYLSIPHEDSLTLTHWSITAWIKMPSSGTQVIMAKTTGNGAHNHWNYCLQIRTLGKPSAEFGCGIWIEATGTTRLQSEKWYHIAGTYNQEFLTIYVDGNPETELTVSHVPGWNTGPLTIGAYSEGGDWGSKSVVIDEVGLFNSALSSDEIQLVMTGGLGETLDLDYAVSPTGKLATAWGQIKVSTLVN